MDFPGTILNVGRRGRCIVGANSTSSDSDKNTKNGCKLGISHDGSGKTALTSNGFQHPSKTWARQTCLRVPISKNFAINSLPAENAGLFFAGPSSLATSIQRTSRSPQSHLFFLNVLLEPFALSFRHLMRPESFTLNAARQARHKIDKNALKL